MIRVIHWAAEGKSVTVGGIEALPRTVTDLPVDDVLWIDLETPDEDEESLVFGRVMPVHSLTVEDITKPRRDPGEGRHLPKVEEFADHLFVIANPLPPRAVAGHYDESTNGRTEVGYHRGRPQLSAILGHHTLVTHHYDRLACVDSVRRYIGLHGEAGRRGPDYLFHLVLDAMVDEYAPLVEGMAGRMEGMETHILLGSADDTMPQLLRMKRRVMSLRRTLVLEREVLSRLARGEFKLVDETEVAYYRNVYDHLARYAGLVEAGREMVSDLMHTQLAAASNRMNEVMKRLTVISTIGLSCCRRRHLRNELQ